MANSKKNLRRVAVVGGWHGFGGGQQGDRWATEGRWPVSKTELERRNKHPTNLLKTVICSGRRGYQ
jgi:hypothetical protein